jgi:autotransporter strand-loop-strand O-heptosyltransferase
MDAKLVKNVGGQNANRFEKYNVELMTYFISTFRKESKFLEIIGDPKDINDYHIEFINRDNDDIEYSTEIKVNHWSELKTESDILIRVKLNDIVVYERTKESKFNKVFISIGSVSLGDTIAWMPYIEEYRKKNNVKVVVFSHHNYLFDKAYPEIEFTNINEPYYFNDIDKKYKIDYGPELYRVDNILVPEQWVVNNRKYDNEVSYFDYRKENLQSIPALILGLEKKEIKPEVNIPNDEPKVKGKYVVVAIQSTSQLKYWNNPFGWERVFDFLNRNGYKIVLIDKYRNFGVLGNYNKAPKTKNLIDKTGNFPLSERIIDIKYADMVITISSGLAWLSWAVGTPVVLISGFTKPCYEFQSNVIRIHNPNVCNGCWNDPKVTFDATDWMFCPKKADFICSKAIQSKDVTDAIKKLMK